MRNRLALTTIACAFAVVISCATAAQAQTLTSAQKATLKTHILATPEARAIYENGDLQGLADFYNATAAPDFWVYRTSIPVGEVFDAIVWANFTPADAVPTDTALNNAIFQSRQIACQTKQMNVQTMLIGQATIDGSRPNVRAGLQDALTNIPSGPSGALRAAGWTTVRDSVLARRATRLEQLFATGGNGATTATAATAVVIGSISYTVFIGL